MILNGKPGTSKWICQMIQDKGRWRPQVRFEAEGVDWFTITWAETDLDRHIESLKELLAGVRAANR